MKPMKLFAAAAIAAGVLMAPTGAIAKENDSKSELQEQKREMQTALNHLKNARKHLAQSGKGTAGARADAAEQTEYAITQVHAAMDDREAEARDREEAERIKREGRERAEGLSGEQRVNEKELDAAASELRKAKEALNRTDADRFGERRAKALNFVDYAIRETDQARKIGKEKGN